MGRFMSRLDNEPLLFCFETVDPVKPLINMHSYSYSAKYLQSVRLDCDDKTGNDKLDDKDFFMSF